jgi:hypothetical protein
VAFNLLLPHSCVVEVAFEADGPKAFDDVVVKYDPPVVRSGPDCVSAASHHQVNGTFRQVRFGYEDFTNPEFIGAQSFSLLERLMQARKRAPSAYFTFLTTYRIKYRDPLAELICDHNRTLLIECLFDGTTDRSQHGQGAQALARHLKLANDDALRAVVRGIAWYQGRPENSRKLTV